MIAESPYTKVLQSKDELLHVGFDYRDEIMSRSMSKQMMRTNSTLSGFITRLGAIVYELSENVKRIKTFGNPALDKNERRLI